MVEHREHVDNFSALCKEEFWSSEGASAVEKVILAANKAVAHINEEHVNKIPPPEIIVKAINQTQEWIKARIFAPNDVSYDETVATERSEMRREQRIVSLRDPPH